MYSEEFAHSEGIAYEDEAEKLVAIPEFSVNSYTIPDFRHH